MLINKERVLKEFFHLIQLPCPSLKERPAADYVIAAMQEMGAESIVEDTQSRLALGGDTGCIVANFKGNKEGAPKILLGAHLDCVANCIGIKPQIVDGVIKSDGTTILGGDDKGGVVAILEAIRCLKEQNIPHGDIQVLFSVSEEQGVAGTRTMNGSLLDADFGYALDSSGRPGKIIFAAPGQNKIFAKIHGKTAHGGVAPEKGINAIKKAAEILCGVPTSRIDEETTCNIGIINGGIATNVVPDLVEVAMDCRSRNKDKMAKLTQEIVDAFVEGGKKIDTPVDIEVKHSYDPYLLDKDSACIQLAARACEALGIEVNIAATGGGSDASHINGFGVPCTVLGTGMTNVHTVEEILLEEDLYMTAEWTLKILAMAAE
ncbi:MAG: M20/M25/M40 family metallo-hydrolase [Phascolarctobacterium sp.]|nr:M20/M25/M40 family metallo-hydrolase [Phascolarctobacterium sp.]